MTPATPAATSAGHRITEELLRELASHVHTSGTGQAGVYEVFTGAPLLNLPQAEPGDVADLVGQARLAQKEWGAWPFRRRARVIAKYLELARDHSAILLDLIQAETGKGRWEAFIEFLEPNLTLSYYLRHGRSILAETGRESMVPLLVSTTEVHHPVGVVGVITPWNFPYALGLSDSLTALLAGNAVILKPDEQTSLDALYAATLLEQAGLPEHCLQILVGPGHTVGAELVEHVDYLAFTGSVTTGRHVNEQLAGRLVGCSLELGGKNPMLVLDDADLAKVAQSALQACFMHAGQVCMAIEKILVPHTSLDRFLDLFARETEQLTYSTGYDFTGTLGSLTGPAQLAKVETMVADALTKGATLVTGGRSRPDLGPYYYEPTILTDVTPAMALYHEEVFGPVVAVSGYDTVDDAVDLANAGEMGLNASIHGRDLAVAQRIARRIRAGTVNINEGFGAAYGSIGATAGGMGQSGLGRRHGPTGLLKYTEPQTIAVQRLSLQAPPQWMRRQVTTAIAKRAYGTLNRFGLR
ncbi:succinic semialdehyde dehydrogenase [Nocardia sp. NPDC059180]|uniref:succinic semialdehyde dehydrogenase n=1 Tax=Nocardia sp. NPDC059180 TaxID=3346761 RepID=UPI0036B73233